MNTLFRFCCFGLSLLLILISYSLRSQTIDPWKITASKIDPSTYYGVTVANGMVGVVSSAEPLKVKNVVLAGAYDQYGRGRVSNFLNSFNLLDMYIEIDGKRLDAASVQNFRQVLDMRHASLTSTFDYGKKATISYTCYSLRQLPFCVLMDLNVSAHQAIQFTAASQMDAPDALKDVQNYYNEIVRPHAAIRLLTSTAKSPTGKLQLCASTSFLFAEKQADEPRITHEMWDNNMHLMRFTKQLAGGTRYRYGIAGTSITSAHDPDPLNEAERLTLYARLEGMDALIAEHNRAWDALWQSDIEVTGDPQSQQDIHSMLYHLYSFSRAGTAYSPSPMGLSGLGYNGHVFWDADLWMFPALLVLHPEIAHSLVEYRFERLENARKNAFAHGYKGAMFPWESAETGVEETPVWALSGPFEHHITADVALAAWQYYCVTQDKVWLRERGWLILSQTADFWTSRVQRNGPGHYDIMNVVAADEWAENIDNNAYTNASAIANLHAAGEAARLLGLPADSDWANVARNIPILRFPDGTTQEHATYHGEGIKQADVNLLSFPLKTITDPKAIARDLSYYETRIPNQGTPAMTHAIFALLYSRLGNGERAFKFFKEAYIPNLNPPFRVIAETKGGTNPYFATGAGGVVQSLLMGFGGIDISPAGLTQVPSSLPAAWRSITITGAGPDHKTFNVRH